MLFNIRPLGGGGVWHRSKYTCYTETHALEESLLYNDYPFYTLLHVLCLFRLFGAEL
jgi:hypothetical protein